MAYSVKMFLTRFFWIRCRVEKIGKDYFTIAVIICICSVIGVGLFSVGLSNLIMSGHMSLIGSILFIIFGIIFILATFLFDQSLRWIKNLPEDSIRKKT